MGDRISVSFKHGNRESVAFFSHWDGLSLLDAVREYVATLDRTSPLGVRMPIDRREPETVMLDFITYHLTYPVCSNYYLGRDGEDGDNSDNGHYVFDLSIGDFIGCDEI